MKWKLTWIEAYVNLRELISNHDSDAVVLRGPQYLVGARGPRRGNRRFGAHIDTGPTSEDMAGLAEQMPVAEYDKNGIFVGVTIPAPAPAIGAPGDGDTETTPWAKG